MNRDYKTFPRSSGKSSSTLLMGVFIGYALGLLTAIGTWMYIKQAPSPFISQENAASITDGKSALNLSSDSPAIEGGGDKPANGESRPRFEFYNMLPDTEEPVIEQPPGQATPGFPSQQAFSSQAAPLQSSEQPSSSTERYYLQAGSFQNVNDAENLKAKLAMLGIEASVQSAALPEKGIWHRVRVGPYTSAGDMDRTRTSLQRSGIQSSPVKVSQGAVAR